MSNQQSKRVLVEKHIAANPQATLKSVARATGVSHNYVYKINKDLKDIEDHARMAANLLPLYTEDLPPMAVSDGSTASYYELPTGCTELQHLISHKDMNAQIGEVFRSCYRYGESSHSIRLRDAKKIKFYIDAEITRLEA